MRRFASKLDIINVHISSLSRRRGFASITMSDLTIDSKFLLASGYKIPVLGYGVCLVFILPLEFIVILIFNWSVFLSHWGKGIFSI